MCQLFPGLPKNIISLAAVVRCCRALLMTSSHSKVQHRQHPNDDACRVRKGMPSLRLFYWGVGVSQSFVGEDTHLSECWGPH